ncbi:hypothetical protein JHK87_005564 [Glycine soja]|nr:hypothetical protein JHK87_005564 [Glycine soja]
MENFEVPSFSLGLDETPPHSPIHPPPSPADLHVSDSDPESRPYPPRPLLKRFRRDLPPPCLDADDDIEEFSSQEDPDQGHAFPSAWNRNHSVCSSSKVSLNGSGVLTPHSCSNSSSRDRKRKELSNDVPASSRFQLLSDSDDLDVDVGAANKANLDSNLEKNKKTLLDEDLWKDFSPVKNVSVPTPAFNEMCEEYFRSAYCKEVGGGDVSKSFNERNPGVSSSCQRDQQQQESTDPVHPAHSYFFHEDPRIRRLVCSRLRNFNPLGTINTVNQQPNVSHIDYMRQFGNGGASNMQGVQNGRVSNSTRGKNKSSNLNVEGYFDASGGWVDPKFVSPFSHGKSSRKKATKRNSTKNSVSKSNNKTNKSNPSNQSSEGWVEPRSCTSLPKDAGKRRVQASGQSAGHWFTSPEGRKA